MVPGRAGSTSFTPVTSQTECSCAISPMRRSASLGTSSDSRRSRANAAFARGSAQPANAFAQRDDGYAGRNVSGKTTSCAPSPAASAVSAASFSIVASRSRMTGSACTHATRTFSRMHRFDIVADGDLAVREDVGVQAGAMHVCLDHAGAREPLERRARLAQLDAEAFDVADAEADAHECVEVDPAGQHVPAALGRAELYSGLRSAILERLGGDQRQRSPGRGVAVVEVAVALEATPRERADALDRRGQLVL